MNAELKLRVAKLREKCAPKQHVALTENILDGFIAAWRKPGYGPAGKYVEEAIAVGYVWEILEVAIDAGQVEQVLDEATDAQKEALCDAADV